MVQSSETDTGADAGYLWTAFSKAFPLHFSPKSSSSFLHPVEGPYELNTNFSFSRSTRSYFFVCFLKFDLLSIILLITLATLDVYFKDFITFLQYSYLHLNL